MTLHRVPMWLWMRRTKKMREKAKRVAAMVALDVKPGNSHYLILPKDTRNQGMRVSRDTPGATNKPGGTNHSNVATNLVGKCQPEKVTGAVRGLPIVTDGGSTHSVQGQVPQVNPPDRTANDPLPPVCTIDSLVTTAGGTPMTKLTETELNKQQQSA